MNKLLMHRAMGQTALKFGVSYEEVYREIKFAISEAVKTQQGLSQSLWEAIPRKGEIPTPEEVINFIAEGIRQ